MAGQLDRLSGEFPTVAAIYPGHGAAAGRELIDDQARYLSWLQERVRHRLVNDRAVTPGERTAIIREVEARHPGYAGVSAIDDLVGRNVDATAEELSRPTPAEPPR